MKKRILISLIVIGLVLGLVLPGAFMSHASPGPATLTVDWHTGASGTGDGLTSMSVRVTGPSYDSGWRTWKGPTEAFTGLTDAATYTVYSSYSGYIGSTFVRTDGVTMSGDTTLYVPCGKLTVTYYANNNPTWPITDASAFLRVTGNLNEWPRTWINGQTTYNLLSTDGTALSYEVKSGYSGGAGTRVDGPFLVPGFGTTIADIPVARFNVKVVGSNFALKGTPITLKAYVGGVQSRSTNDWVNDWYVSLLSGINYEFRATKGGSTASTTVLVNEVPPPGLAGVILMIP